MLFLKLAVALLVLSVMVGEVFGQVRVVVSVTDSTRRPFMETFSGRLYHKNLQAMVSFGTSKTGVLSLKVADLDIDSSKLCISADGYLADTVLLLQRHVLGDSLHLSAQLLPIPPSTLPSATVTAPAVWKRGDTTFYNVEKHLGPGDTKLKDLVKKLPDFRLDQNGVLHFKNKPVEKIMIEGEEVFADKLELMLNSFPTHVLDQVQALENQNDNRLLTGLKDEEKVFVNLKLKKKYLATAFGDLAVGADTKARYILNPVLFTLAGKVKIGAIVNANTVGTGTTAEAYDEVKGKTAREYDNWTIQSAHIGSIANFESRRYIQNRLFDGRVNVLLPMSSKTKAKVEAYSIIDNLRQSANAVSTLLDSNGFITRSDSNRFLFSPTLYAISATVLHMPTPQKQFDFRLHYTTDRSRFRQDNVFSFSNRIGEESQASIRNKFGTLSASATHTHRVDKATALVTTVKALHSKGNQTIHTAADNLPAIFDLPTKYTRHQLNLLMDVSRIDLSLLVLKQKPGRFNRTNILLGGEQLTPQLSHRFSAPSGTVVDTLLQALSNRGEFSSIFGTASRQYRFFPSKQPIVADFTLGGRSIATDGFTRLFAVADVSFRTKKKLSKKLTGSVDANYAFRPRTLREQVDWLYPSGLQTSVVYANGGLPVSTAKANAQLAFRRLGFGATINTSYQFLFNGAAIGSSVFGQLLSSKTTFVNLPQHLVNTMAQIDYFHSKRKLYVIVNYTNAFATNLYSLASTVGAGSLRSNTVAVQLSKQWKKQSFEFFGFAFVRRTTTPFGPVQAFKSLNQTARYKSQIFEWLGLGMASNFLANQVSAADRQRFLFMDVECFGTIPKTKFRYRIILDDATNNRQFRSGDVAADRQYQYTVPLVGRNLQFSLSFNL